jgi:hypothetical protein
VRAARSYAHNRVRIQRLTRAGWMTNQIVRLNRFGQATFKGRFPRGTSRGRAWVTRAPGYTVGFSTTKLFHR